jgi:hypothetical protein
VFSPTSRAILKLQSLGRFLQYRSSDLVHTRTTFAHCGKYEAPEMNFLSQKLIGGAALNAQMSRIPPLGVARAICILPRCSITLLASSVCIDSARKRPVSRLGGKHLYELKIGKISSIVRPIVRRLAMRGAPRQLMARTEGLFWKSSALP